MKKLFRPWKGVVCLLATLFSAGALAQIKPPQTGPETEKRFPPLKVPSGFKATLFACDPLIEYPSAIALGPRSNSIFVAVDYMTGLGTEIVRRDEIRLVEDTDDDGYADRTTVYAGEFNSIQGLAYHDGTVYVMHAPFLTALRDTDGDGKADERRNLLSGLGLTPEENPVRLHCANGIVVGYDGWLYLALGDHGCNVLRPEGDRLVLQGGGILRCRPDGRDLHVFASGLRNIYDVALDDELNVFVRDNENDGGDYKIRVCHSFFGADHGYPYLYYERPREALPPLADLGLGSSAGGLCYLETAFPSEYHGDLFFCEWGRAVVRYHRERAGSSFGSVKEVEFAAAAANDPYGFKPTDLVVERDGALIVADWADGQRPKRGRGRIYRIAYASTAERPAKETEFGQQNSQTSTRYPWLAQLDSESYYQRIEAQTAGERNGHEILPTLKDALRKGELSDRARMHAVWMLARVDGSNSVPDLLRLAETDRDPRVRVQAIRAVADLADPTLAQHRLDAGPGDATLSNHLAALGAREPDPRVLLEAIVALGRLRWRDAPAWLQQKLREPDFALAHAAMQALRRSENWSAILKLLDEADTQPIRAIALRALADRVHPEVVDGLIERLQSETDPARRREYADALTRVYKKPGPWVYWGYRPPPRPANTVAWEKTAAIEQALDRVLADPDRAVRLAVVQRMQREKIPTRPTTLGQWLRQERDPEPVAAILLSMRDQPADEVHSALREVVAAQEHTLINRLAALTLYVAGLDKRSEMDLLNLTEATEDGPVVAEALRHIAKRRDLKSSTLLVAKLDSPEPTVRAAAVEAVAQLHATEASEHVSRLLADVDANVRLAAVSAAGALQIHSASSAVLNLAQDPDLTLRRASLNSLRLLKEKRVVPLAVAALKHRETQLTALDCLSDLGGPPQLKAVLDLALHDPSAEVLASVVRLLTRWSVAQPDQRRQLDRAIAEVQGASGALLRWRTTGPLGPDAANALATRIVTRPEAAGESDGPEPEWQTLFASGAESRVALGSSRNSEGQTVWLAHTDLLATEPAPVQFLGSSRGALRVWLNGQRVYQREEAGVSGSGSDRFEGQLQSGVNHLLVQASSTNVAEFSVRLRRKSAAVEHERLAQEALSRSGNGERGRKLFFNVEKSQCLKCHRLADQGEQIGPELTGVGGRFSRVYIIESILEPSRTIAPSFQMIELLLNDGRELSGVPIAERDGLLTLADNQGRKQMVARATIKEQRAPSLSLMPEGLEKALTTEEFIDLVEFLVSQKQARAR